jgi:hypothetical protein
VDPNRTVRLKKFKDFLGLVRAQIVGDDMNLTTCRLTLYDLCKKIDKLGAGVACAGFRQDLSGLSVQSAVERKGSNHWPCSYANGEVEVQIAATLDWLTPTSLASR